MFSEIPVASANGSGAMLPGAINRPPRAGRITAVSGAPGEAAQAQAAAGWDHGDAQDTLSRPPGPLPGYQVIETTIADGSAAAGRKLGDVTWPPASTPVSVLRGRQLRPPHPGSDLVPGDRVSLLIPALQNPPPPPPGAISREQPASHQGTSHQGTST
jgi:hypothetical protein